MTRHRHIFFLVLTLVCALVCVCAQAEESAPVPYTFSITYVTHSQSVTVGTTETGFMHQFTVDDHPGALPEGMVFLGWSAIPNGEIDYTANGKLTALTTNPHAILYAVYDDAEKPLNVFKAEYLVGSHWRYEYYRAAESSVSITLPEFYSDAYTAWRIADADYAPGDTYTLTDETTSFTAIPAADFTESPTFYFRVNYVGFGQYTYPADGNSPVGFITVGIASDGTPVSSDELLGWSLTKDGAINYTTGTKLIMQYSVPDITFYPVYPEGKAPAVKADDVPDLGNTVIHVPGPAYVFELVQPMKPTFTLHWSLTNDGVHTLLTRPPVKIPLTAFVSAVVTTSTDSVPPLSDAPAFNDFGCPTSCDCGCNNDDPCWGCMSDTGCIESH